jgi:hypothetical protein
MKLPNSVREQFRAYGRKGGQTRALRMPPEARKIVARKAAIRRWIRVRFGVASFEAIGLPGGKTIDAGLAALAAGEETIEALLVSLAAPRLNREGVPLPSELLPDADIRLYRLLERENGDLAHARYLACLRQAASFADACADARLTGGRDARGNYQR